MAKSEQAAPASAIDADLNGTTEDIHDEFACLIKRPRLLSELSNEIPASRNNCESHEIILSAIFKHCSQYYANISLVMIRRAVTRISI